MRTVLFTEKLFYTQLVDETGKRTAGLKPGYVEVEDEDEDAWSDSD